MHRNEFESVADGVGYNVRKDSGGDYFHVDTNIAWEIWKESRAQGAEPFAWCFTDVNGKPTELTGNPVHRCKQDKRIYTPLYTQPQSARVPSVLYDGYAVLQEVKRARSESGSEDVISLAMEVSDVLDAVVRLIKQESE